LWLHSLKVAQLLRSAACLHTNQSRSYLNHLVLIVLQWTDWITKGVNKKSLLESGKIQMFGNDKTKIARTKKLRAN